MSLLTANRPKSKRPEQVYVIFSKDGKILGTETLIGEDAVICSYSTMYLVIYAQDNGISSYDYLVQQVYRTNLSGYYKLMLNLNTMCLTPVEPKNNQAFNEYLGKLANTSDSI